MVYFDSFCRVLEALGRQSHSSVKRKILKTYFEEVTPTTEEMMTISKLVNLKANKILTGLSTKRASGFALEQDTRNQPGFNPTLEEVLSIALQITKITGVDSANRCKSFFTSVTGGLKTSQRSWLLKILCSNLRIGLDSISLKKAITDHSGVAVSSGVSSGSFNLARNLVPGKTIGPCFIEPKYDGIRVMVRMEASSISVITRRGDQIFSKLEGIQKVLDSLNQKEIVIDCQLVMPSFYSFSTILRHKERLFEDYTLKAFDILRIGQNCLVNKPLSTRKTILKQVLEHQGVDPRIEAVPYHTKEGALTIEEGRVLIAEMGSSVQGLIVKPTQSNYEPGRRSWFKLKRERETMDLVVLKRKLGKGKFCNTYSSFELGVLKLGRILPITNVGSGFTEEELKILDNQYSWNGEVPVTRIIFQVAYDQLIPSQNEVGKSLRFPIFKKIREDKNQPSDIEDFTS